VVIAIRMSWMLSTLQEQMIIDMARRTRIWTVPLVTASRSAAWTPQCFGLLLRQRFSVPARTDRRPKGAVPASMRPNSSS
jgi:hypothetical protein